MRKTGLCGVVIATLFGTAGLLQHPSHQVHKQVSHQISSPLAEAGVSLLNSYDNFSGRQTVLSTTLLPEGFLRVTLKPGPTPAQLAAYAKLQEARRVSKFDQAVAAQQEAAARAQAQAEAEAQAQAQAEAQAQAQAQAEAQAQAQAAAAAQSQKSTNSSPPAGGVWAELRNCESGGDYSADTGNGYYGAYQFLLSTWEDLGFSGLPSNAPPAEQDQAAQELQARSGWGQWPACAAELGLD
jgi:resuscitation-promoting factor RpfB